MQPTPLELKGLHLPEAISWWPPALGWWLLAAGTVGLLVLAYYGYRRLTRKTALKSAQCLLAAIKQNPNLDNTQKLRELSALLRRVAISVAPEMDVAGLTGRAWLLFLDKPLQGSPFSLGVGACLADAPYRQAPLSDTEIAQLIKLCEDWLKQCVKPVRPPSLHAKKSL